MPLFIWVEEAPAHLTSDLSILVPSLRSLSPDPCDQNFCEGLTEEVVHKLAKDRRLRVITQSAAVWLEQSGGLKPCLLLEASVRQAGA